jgi:hypothetical protein
MAKMCQMQARSEISATPVFPPTDRSQNARSVSKFTSEITIRFTFRRAAPVALLFLLYCLTAGTCHAQSRDVLCREGSGDFEAEFASGVRAHVGATRNLELAARACAATLSWSDQSMIVASDTAELDLDAFGVDLGLGAPVAAFQVKKSKADCCMEYKIYSLRMPPVLLHSIRGGDFFSAADTDLDGKVEIWTDDAAAVDGFENLRLNSLDFAPPVVLRFTRGRLLDASAEFRAYFDQKIADQRAKLSPQDLADFKASDGKLPAAPAAAADQLHRLQGIKMRVLEIVWSYLYSGREQEAWRSLAGMWPSADVDRIRTALLNMRSHGVLSQADGLSSPVPPGQRMHTKIFDATVTVMATPGITPKDAKPKREIRPPRAILMEREPPSDVYEAELARSESLLKLVIDSAGKVRSVEVMGNAQTIDEGLVRSTANWKFIPGFDESDPVASQIFLGVSLKR